MYCRSEYATDVPAGNDAFSRALRASRLRPFDWVPALGDVKAPTWDRPRTVPPDDRRTATALLRACASAPAEPLAVSPAPVVSALPFLPDRLSCVEIDGPADVRRSGGALLAASGREACVAVAGAFGTAVAATSTKGVGAAVARTGTVVARVDAEVAVGTAVGRFVAGAVGSAVGCAVGRGVVRGVGRAFGCTVSASVARGVGCRVGAAVGASARATLTGVAARVGADVARAVRFTGTLGSTVGAMLGVGVGGRVGRGVATSGVAAG